jgi:uncharacterized low-complexity protein
MNVAAGGTVIASRWRSNHRQTVEMQQMSNKVVKTLSLAMGAALIGSVTVANAATAFQVKDLGPGYMLVGEEKPEGSCGADKKEGAEETKGEEGKCGEGKCGEGKCGADKDKEAGEEKTPEGSCGGKH